MTKGNDKDECDRKQVSTQTQMAFLDLALTVNWPVEASSTPQRGVPVIRVACGLNYTEVPLENEPFSVLDAQLSWS